MTLGSAAAPLAFTLQGARPDLTPPALVVWGVAGAFRLNQRSIHTIRNFAT